MAAPAVTDRAIRVPAQQDSFARVTDVATETLYLVLGPLATTLHALPEGTQGTLSGQWDYDGTNPAWGQVWGTAWAQAPTVDQTLPQERYGDLFIGDAGMPLAFEVRDRNTGAAGPIVYTILGPLAATLRPYLTGVSGYGATLFLTGVWSDAARTVQATAYRLATVGDGLTVLSAAETGKSSDMIVPDWDAARSRAAVAAGQGTYTVPAGAPNYWLPPGGGPVPLALQGAVGVTTTGSVSPALTDPAQLAQTAAILKYTAAQTGTTVQDQFDKMAATLVAGGGNSPEIQDFLGQQAAAAGLAPGGGMSGPGLLAAAGLGALLFLVPEKRSRKR